jgi:hypothetical protein
MDTIGYNMHAFGCKCPLPGGENAYRVYMYFLARAWEVWISTMRQRVDVPRIVPSVCVGGQRQTFSQS